MMSRGEIPTGEDTHGSDYFTSLFLLPQLCNSTVLGSPSGCSIGSARPPSLPLKLFISGIRLENIRPGPDLGCREWNSTRNTCLGERAAQRSGLALSRTRLSAMMYWRSNDLYPTSTIARLLGHATLIIGFPVSCSVSRGRL